MGIIPQHAKERKKKMSKMSKKLQKKYIISMNNAFNYLCEVSKTRDFETGMRKKTYFVLNSLI